MGTSKNFDSMIISAENVWKIMHVFFVVSISFFILSIIITGICYWKIQKILSLNCIFALFKMAASIIAIIFVFCYDYKIGDYIMFHIYDMTAATFFVGFLAMLEVFSSLLTMINELLSILDVLRSKGSENKN